MLAAWLRTAPGLEEVEIGVDGAGPAPGGGGLFPAGVEVLQCRRDLLGGQTLRCRATFVLRLVLPTDTAPRNARLVLRLAAWVQARSAAGDTPRLGSADFAAETMTAASGRLERAGVGGSNVYSLRLIAEYTEKYNGTEDNKGVTQ